METVLNPITGNLDIVNSQADINFTFGSNNTNFFILKGKDGGVYQVVRRFIFKGTNILGVPLVIRIIADVIGISNPLRVRVYDLTNALIIAENNNVTSLEPTIQDMGTLSNFSTTESVIEIQAQITTNVNNEDGFVYGLQISF